MGEDLDELFMDYFRFIDRIYDKFITARTITLDKYDLLSLQDLSLQIKDKELFLRTNKRLNCLTAFGGGQIELTE